ncbi:MAG: hypothetical protein KKE79_02750 [Actinobacteria bacterium]|nr:hypothetical protein [Actinomycetota bacterium]
MASKKQKKKKKKLAAGGQRATYATGKKVEPPDAEKTGGKAPAGKKAPGAGARDRPEGGRGEQWNIVRRGTLEMKVFLAIMALLALGALLQYPLWTDVANEQYQELGEEYPAQLKEWENKYKTKEERKEHEKEKPQEPKKPVFGDFLLYQALILVLQGAIFTFLAINVSRRTDMGTPVLDRALSGEGRLSDAWDMLINAVPWGIATLVVLLLSTITGEALGLAGETRIQEYPAWKSSLNFINLAINNQVLFVFLAVSALVWMFTRSGRLKVEPHWAGIVAATLLAFGYFYMISSSSGDKVVIALAGSFFFALSLVGMLGYLYWKKGLEYSLLAGIVALGLYPFLAVLIT